MNPTAMRLADELEEKATEIENSIANAEELGRAAAYREISRDVRERFGVTEDDLERFVETMAPPGVEF